MEYIHAPLGLYPAPAARSSKSGTITRLKAKYKFLGTLGRAVGKGRSGCMGRQIGTIVAGRILKEERSLYREITITVLVNDFLFNFLLCCQEAHII